MSSTLYNVAVSGLQSAQVGLTTTGNNVANANTSGYTRQQVVQSASAPAFSGAGFVGTGTNVETVRRVYTGVLSNQAIAAQSSASEYAARSEVSASLATSIGDPTTSVAATMDGFFAAASQLASNPSDSAARSGFLLSADAVAGRFRSMQEQLDTARSGAADRVRAGVDQVNSLARQIAAVNDAIAGSNGSGHTPNDLLDKRDALLVDLNKLVRANTVARADGTVDVSLSNGQSLVLPGMVNKLAVKTNPQDSRSLIVGMQEGSDVRELGNQSSLGGEIGGLLAFRDNELTQAQADLGALAAKFAAAVNAEHQKGFDAAGRAGGALFSFDTLRPAGAASNRGSAVLNASAGDGSALAASDYRLEVKAGGVTVTRLSDGTSTDFGSLPASVDGISFSLKSGSAAQGDSFVLSSSQGLAGTIRNAISDPRRIAAAADSGAASGDNRTLLAIADLQTRTLDDGATLVQSNARMVSRAAERSGELATESAVRTRLLDEATSARESASGVNLDEEAANLMRYQQAYQASGRVIAVANTLFDTLLSLGH